METREYRYPVEELRFDKDKGIVEGTVMRYGDQARVPTLMGTFTETVQPGAFGDLSDVTLNISHDKKRVFARTGGGGLELSDTKEALTMRATLPDTTEGKDAREYLTSGVLRGLSVEMRIKPGGEKLEKRGGQNFRTIESANLNGIGIVDRPAYGESQAVLKRFEVLEDEEVRVDDPPEEHREDTAGVAVARKWCIGLEYGKPKTDILTELMRERMAGLEDIEFRFESEYYYDDVETIGDTGAVRKREITSGAFDGSIRDPNQEITLSIGRNPNDAIGSKLAGTLVLETVDDRLIARVENPPDTAGFRDLQARIAAGASVYMEPLFRELDGEYTDVDEPGNPGVKIRQYKAVKLYGLGLSPRGKKGQRATGAPPPQPTEDRDAWRKECLGVFATA